MPRALLVLLLVLAPASAEWSVHSQRQRLQAFLRQWPDGDLDPKLVEVAKRFRDPRLRERFRALAAHDGDWRLRHRGLFALERLGDPADYDAAAALLDHPQRRLREKAAIACILLWRPGAATPDPEDERDFHVRRCLEALRRRAAGRLTLAPEEEHTETLADGLAHAPFLEQPVDAPGAVADGDGPAPAVADRWTPPLLGWGEEVVDDAPLEPFGRVDGGRVHLGLDRGACLDGAGVYAPAEGLVRRVVRGGPHGTVVVLEHQLAPGERVCTMLMHLSGTLFVAPGETVAGGQLLGTIGMGFSRENGGCLAHLHLAVYPGPFDPEREGAYQPKGEPLGAWDDPEEALAAWMAWTKPLVADLRPVGASLRGVRSDAVRGSIGRAYAAAVRARDREEPGSEAHVDATYLAGELARAPENALDRARALHASGYPREALEELKRGRAALRSLPGAEALEEQEKAWRDDDGFQKALRGEGRVRRADPRDRAAWRELLADYGDTCLAARIHPRLK